MSRNSWIPRSGGILAAHGGLVFQGSIDGVQYVTVLAGYGGSANNGAGGMSGSYPNLFNMSPQVHASFEAIVLNGAFSYASMASFAENLSQDEVSAIHAFIIVQQQKVVKEAATPNKAE